jgi:predicted ATPase
MIITKIHIKDHQQFKDLELDLTYPAGHEKAGEPLDKVCFIGQSGTGKTTLLEEIWDRQKLMYSSRYTNPVRHKNLTLTFSSHTQFSGISSYFHLQNESKHGKKSTPNLYNIFRLFSLSLENSGWDKIKDLVEKHQQEITKYAFAISKAFKNNDYKLAEKHSQKLKKWEKENETPLNDLAENYLNPILKDFALEVKTELESLEEVNQINLINKNLETIPQQFWSTGIKNIIARTIPLYTHNFENSIICIDEPETSLYPDIQRKIIDIYSRLAPNNQFFYATHSPIIASSFEPWEIVELRFDDEGYVYRDQYWEGENHVDNYKYDPRYLRWDSILQNIFDLENDGSDERKEMLQEFSNLDNKLKERKRKGDKLSKEDPEVQKLMKMGKQLGWDTKQGKA